MEQYIQSTITILSLVNPVICGLLFSNAVSGKPRAVQIAAATRTTLIIMVILWLAAIGFYYLVGDGRRFASSRREKAWTDA